MTNKRDAAIKSTLLTVWDPIGISSEPSAQDEYDSYIAPLRTLMLGRVGLTQIVAFLTQTEASMGLVPDVVRAETVAKNLLTLSL